MAFDPVTALLGIGGKLIDKLLPDPQAAAAAKIEMMKMAAAGELEALKADVAIATGQMEINKTEAANSSLFVSGWRPAVGWVCVSGLIYTFIASPLLSWYSTWQVIPSPPDLDLGVLITLLGGLLGLGGFRTYEKVKGVARS